MLGPRPLIKAMFMAFQIEAEDSLALEFNEAMLSFYKWRFDQDSIEEIKYESD